MSVNCTERVLASAMAVTLYHETLKSTLTGVDASLSAHFRGITYGEVSERFAEAKEALLPEELDCTKFGYA